MEDKLVEFDTAKLAKEKGFDWKVSLHYESNGNRFINKVECNFNNVELICSAPTQSLLQKWLRKEHKIEVVVFKNKNGYSFEFDYADKFEIGKLSNYIAYQTYEEALEIALQEGLKLIK